jgi:hypothetical protein
LLLLFIHNPRFETDLYVADLYSTANLVINLTLKQGIVNALHFRSHSFHENLPRYFRCLFQLALKPTTTTSAGPPANTEVAESVLNRACVLARDTAQSATNQQPLYPDDELEWLATTAFNQAVDFYLASRDKDCQRWGQRAIELAGLMHDDQGTLAKLLREKFAGLRAAE